MVDITPPMKTHLCGDGTGKHRPAHAVLDPLYAKAMVFDAGDQRVCILALDLSNGAKPYADQVRKTVADALGINPAAVIVCANQTHSAPSLGGNYA